jgi:hypothetical protein
MRQPRRTIEDHFQNEWTQGVQWPQEFLDAYLFTLSAAITDEWENVSEQQQQVMDGHSMSGPYLTYLDFKYLNLIVVTKVKLSLLEQGIKKSISKMTSPAEVQILNQALIDLYFTE